jgi:hypothetical protein
MLTSAAVSKLLVSPNVVRNVEQHAPQADILSVVHQTVRTQLTRIGCSRVLVVLRHEVCVGQPWQIACHCSRALTVQVATNGGPRGMCQW